MGGFATKETEEKKEERELPSKDYVKDGFLEYGPKSATSLPPSAQDWLGLGHEPVHGLSPGNHSAEALEELSGREGRLAMDPFNMGADEPFAHWGDAVPTKPQGMLEMTESMETLGRIANPLGAAKGLDDLTARDATPEKRIKGGVGALGSIMSMFPPTAPVGTVLQGSVAAYDMTKAGSEDLKKQGILGKNEDGSNRDAANWAVHFGEEFTKMFTVDGLLPDEAGPYHKLLGMPGVALGSLVGGSMALQNGAMDTVADIAKPVGLSPDMFEKAKAIEAKKDAEEVQKERKFKESLKGLSPQERERQQAMHDLMSFWAD